MENFFDILRYSILAVISGLLVLLVGKSEAKLFFGFVLFCSIFLLFVITIFPFAADSNIRQRRINRYMGKE
jgi:hypothetical protein